MLGNRQRRHRSGIEQVGGEQLRLPPFVPDEISFQWSSPEAFLHTGGGGDWTTTDKCLYATLELKQLGLSYVEAFKVLNESHPYGLHQSLADTIHAVTFVYEITDGELLNVLNPPFFEAARGEVFSRALFALGRSRVQVFDAYIEAVHPQDPIDQAYWLILHDRRPRQRRRTHANRGPPTGKLAETARHQRRQRSGSPHGGKLLGPGLLVPVPP
jgi:hypothetical protein